ncbi:hypothetical protein ACSDQ9_05285 [Aestuariimicrobium soli]|uniref:hypothetical protein n=1 Tax=Aestuariimicrobium soli TaxID=2035834 RepID=UPI003EB7F18B
MDQAGVVVIILIAVVGLIGLAAVVGVILLSLRSGRVQFEELPQRRRPAPTSPQTADEPTHVRLDPSPGASAQKES